MAQDKDDQEPEQTNWQRTEGQFIKYTPEELASDKPAQPLAPDKRPIPNQP